MSFHGRNDLVMKSFVIKEGKEGKEKERKEKKRKEKRLELQLDFLF
jgi:hypothetical protein